jgi:hypothetical protein
MLGFVNKDYAELLKEHPEPEYQDVADLCYMTVVANLGEEIIGMHTASGPNFNEAQKKRIAEIEKALGPRMVQEVEEYLGEWWPPYCFICGGEGAGPEGGNGSGHIDELEVYSTGGGSVDWAHTSCTEKLHAEGRERFFQELMQYFAGEHEFRPGTNGATWAAMMKEKVEADPSLLLPENRAKFDSELRETKNSTGIRVTLC